MKILPVAGELFHADRQTQTHRQTDRHTDRQTDTQTGRQTDRHDEANSRVSQFYEHGVWNIGGITTGRNRSIQTKTCPSATLSTTIPT
jgi:hypothetical protein